LGCEFGRRLRHERATQLVFEFGHEVGADEAHADVFPVPGEA
jgi:hypothetical protein